MEIDKHNKEEFLNAKKFYEIVENLYSLGKEKFHKDIKIGCFEASKGDSVNEQYDLMLDYFQEKGMELVLSDYELEEEIEK